MVFLTCRVDGVCLSRRQTSRYRQRAIELVPELARTLFSGCSSEGSSLQTCIDNYPVDEPTKQFFYRHSLRPLVLASEERRLAIITPRELRIIPSDTADSVSVHLLWRVPDVPVSEIASAAWLGERIAIIVRTRQIVAPDACSVDAQRGVLLGDGSVGSLLLLFEPRDTDALSPGCMKLVCIAQVPLCLLGLPPVPTTPPILSTAGDNVLLVHCAGRLVCLWWPATSAVPEAMFHFDGIQASSGSLTTALYSFIISTDTDPISEEQDVQVPAVPTTLQICLLVGGSDGQIGVFRIDFDSVPSIRVISGQFTGESLRAGSMVTAPPFTRSILPWRRAVTPLVLSPVLDFSLYSTLPLAFVVVSEQLAPVSENTCEARLTVSLFSVVHAVSPAIVPEVIPLSLENLRSDDSLFPVSLESVPLYYEPALEDGSCSVTISGMSYDAAKDVCFSLDTPDFPGCITFPMPARCSLVSFSSIIHKRDPGHPPIAGTFVAAATPCGGVLVEVRPPVFTHPQGSMMVQSLPRVVVAQELAGGVTVIPLTARTLGSALDAIEAPESMAQYSHSPAALVAIPPDCSRYSLVPPATVFSALASRVAIGLPITIELAREILVRLPSAALPGYENVQQALAFLLVKSLGGSHSVRLSDPWTPTLDESLLPNLVATACAVDVSLSLEPLALELQPSFAPPLFMPEFSPLFGSEGAFSALLEQLRSFPTLRSAVLSMMNVAFRSFHHRTRSLDLIPSGLLLRLCYSLVLPVIDDTRMIQQIPPQYLSGGNSTLLWDTVLLAVSLIGAGVTVGELQPLSPLQLSAVRLTMRQRSLSALPLTGLEPWVVLRRLDCFGLTPAKQYAQAVAKYFDKHAPVSPSTDCAVLDEALDPLFRALVMIQDDNELPDSIDPILALLRFSDTVGGASQTGLLLESRLAGSIYACREVSQCPLIATPRATEFDANVSHPCLVDPTGYDVTSTPLESLVDALVVVVRSVCEQQLRSADPIPTLQHVEEALAHHSEHDVTLLSPALRVIRCTRAVIAWDSLYVEHGEAALTALAALGVTSTELTTLECITHVEDSIVSIILAAHGFNSDARGLFDELLWGASDPVATLTDFVRFYDILEWGADARGFVASHLPSICVTRLGLDLTARVVFELSKPLRRDSPAFEAVKRALCDLLERPLGTAATQSLRLTQAYLHLAELTDVSVEEMENHTHDQDIWSAVAASVEAEAWSALLADAHLAFPNLGIEIEVIAATVLLTHGVEVLPQEILQALAPQSSARLRVCSDVLRVLLQLDTSAAEESSAAARRMREISDCVRAAATHWQSGQDAAPVSFTERQVLALIEFCSQPIFAGRMRYLAHVLNRELYNPALALLLLAASRGVPFSLITRALSFFTDIQFKESVSLILAATTAALGHQSDSRVIAVLATASLHVIASALRLQYPEQIEEGCDFSPLDVLIEAYSLIPENDATILRSAILGRLRDNYTIQIPASFVRQATPEDIQLLIGLSERDAQPWPQLLEMLDRR